MLGIGCIIARASRAHGRGRGSAFRPAIVLSFICPVTACAFAALSYAELAGANGGAGSAYGYAYSGIAN